MRTVGTVLIVIGILFGLFAGWSFWRDHRFKQARTVTKGTIASVKIEPIRSGLSNILYTITYLRDGITDTTEHKITQQYSIKDPLPTIVQLQSANFYVHYVPRDRRSKTSFPKRSMVLDSETYPGFYNRASLGQMFTFILMGFMVRGFFPKKQRLQY